MIAMVMDEKTIPLDLIIHPGEILAEVLEERGITCAELADRTGFPIIYKQCNCRERRYFGRFCEEFRADTGGLEIFLV